MVVLQRVDELLAVMLADSSNENWELGSRSGVTGFT
jgi:hypothetical protein